MDLDEFLRLYESSLLSEHVDILYDCKKKIDRMKGRPLVRILTENGEVENHYDTCFWNGKNVEDAPYMCFCVHKDLAEKKSQHLIKLYLRTLNK